MEKKNWTTFRGGSRNGTRLAVSAGTKWTLRGGKKSAEWGEGEVSEALYGLGARGIRGLPLAGALSPAPCLFFSC